MKTAFAVPLVIISFVICRSTYAADPTALLAPSNLRFTENKGQIRDQYNRRREDIQFQLSTGGMNVFIGNGKIHYQWVERVQQADDTLAANRDDIGLRQSTSTPVFHSYRLDMELLGANPDANMLTEEVLPDAERYYTQSLNGTRAQSFRKITYKNIYPAIDWVLYVKGKTFKYDFIVHPGAEVADIKIRYTGADTLFMQSGAITVRTPMGSVREQPPYSYVQASDTRVKSNFILEKDGIGFEVENYEGTLIIDPVLDLEWGTYYGGSGQEWSNIIGVIRQEYSNAVTTDYAGNVYLTGVTSSLSNIATTGAHQQTFGGGNSDPSTGGTAYVHGDVFLVKFNADGQRLWATYYGGEGDEYTGKGKSLACDREGNVYWAGSTDSHHGIATPGAHQPELSGYAYILTNDDTLWHSDNFLVKLNGEGTRIWATYYGGRYWEEGGSVAVSEDGGQIYLCGNSRSDSNIVTPGAEITTVGNPINATRNSATGYLARFNGAGQRLWGTFIGNRGIYNNITDVALSRSGAVYVTGYTGDGITPAVTTNNYIATPGSFQYSLGGCPYFICPSDAFLQKWDSNGNRQWGTFYGGSESDVAFGVSCDEEENVYITGFSSSTTGLIHGASSIATAGSFQPLYSGGYRDAFLAKFNGTGQRQWGTYYGRSNASPHTYSGAYALDYADGYLFLSGVTDADSMATSCAYQTSRHDSRNATFLARFTTSGFMDYHTYYGGRSSNFGYALAVDKATRQSVYIAGYTNSVDHIATPGSFLDSFYYTGSYDAFLAKFAYPVRDTITSCFQADSIRITATDTSGSNYAWNNDASGKALWVKNSGTYIVRYEKTPGCMRSDTFLVNIYPLPALETTRRCPGEGFATARVAEDNRNVYIYTWLDAAGNFVYSNESDTGSVIQGREAGHYTLHIATPAGCDTVLDFEIKAYPAVDLNVHPDTTITVRNAVHLWATGAGSYHWQPEQWLDNTTAATPLSNPERSITYTVSGKNKYGCEASAEVHIEVLDAWFVPNAFTPNGDGVNDLFRIENYGYQRIKFSVFNRWGQLVFLTTDGTRGWDGTFKGEPAESGTYFYQIQITSAHGKTETVKGDVLLLR